MLPTQVSSSGQLRSPKELLDLLQDLLPLDENVVHAFGYGSGVLHQQQQDASNDAEIKVVDVVLVVKDALRFHKLNRQLNPHHYTGLLASSAARCAWIQTHKLPENKWLRNPGVYFNNTPGIKYGVVEVNDLSDDLNEWRYLYLAGRLHKPVVTIIEEDPMLSQLQNEQNLPAALSAALLLQYNNHHRQHTNDTASLQQQSEQQVYTTIASLSYQGDPRMTVQAEDPNKVARLVGSPQHLERWRDLYRPAALELEQAGVLSTTDGLLFQWDSHNPLAHNRLWQSLPEQVRRNCGYNSVTTTTTTTAIKSDSSPEVAAAAARQLPLVLASSIVAPAARYQTFKGLWTAGFAKSVSYAYRKFTKGLLQKR